MSNRPRSAVRATSTKCRKFTPASAWACGCRHAARWCPAGRRKSPSLSCRSVMVLLSGPATSSSRVVLRRLDAVLRQTARSEDEVHGLELRVAEELLGRVLGADAGVLPSPERDRRPARL